MNAAHLHLALNHLAVIGLPFCLIGLIFALKRKSNEMRSFFAGALVVIALASIGTFLSGDAAEKVVEHLSGVTEALIEAHEEAAELAFYLTLVCGALGAVSLAFFGRTRSQPRILDQLLILSVLVSSVLLGRAALLGGEIRHTEIRTDFVAVEGHTD